MNESLQRGDRWRPLITPHVHDYLSEITLEPTCLTTGTLTYICDCGNSYTEEIEALGHNYSSEFIIDQEPSCTVAGLKSRHCMRCNATTDEISIDATGHDWGDWYECDYPDCINPGLNMRDCNICSFSESENLDPTGHSWETEFTEDQEATCTTDGSKSRHCNECWDAVIDDTVIPATGHDWDGGCYYEPTHDEDGYTEYYCNYCSECHIVVDEGSKLPPFIQLTLDDGTVIDGTSTNDLSDCCTHNPSKIEPTSELTIGGVTFRRNQVKKVKFGPDEYFTEGGEFGSSLSHFGWNFTNLIEIDRIPSGITGDYCLTYFLAGCTSFNHPIVIPEGVSGYQCLYDFLKGCTSFNQPIVIPEGVGGTECLNGFLSGCTSFNQPITIHDVYGYGGEYFGLLYGCDSMISPIKFNSWAYYSPVGSGNVGVGTFATSNPSAPMYTQGIPISSDTYSINAIKSAMPNSDTDPYRKLI